MIMIRITLAFMTTTMLLVVMVIGGGGGGDDGVHPNPLLSSLASINRVNIGEVVRNCNLALFINIFTIIIIVKAINHNRHTVNVCPSAEYCRPNMDGSATCDVVDINLQLSPSSLSFKLPGSQGCSSSVHREPKHIPHSHTG